MHRKTESEATTIEGVSTPPPSPPPPSQQPPRTRPFYYVQSPSQHDADKMSYISSTPFTSPPRNHHHHHYHYHCSPIHHSRESSTSRFSSSSLKPHHHHRSSSSGWRKLYGGSTRDDVALKGRGDGVDDDEEDDDGDGGGESGGVGFKFYVGCFLVSFVFLFGVFSFILWAASKAYRPYILVKNMVFLDFTIQAGMDGTGVPTDMLSLNSTVRIHYRNPATFFGVHVTSTPLELYYYNLKVASGQMKRFYQRRKSHCNVTTVIHGHQIPLYGGMLTVSDVRQDNNNGYKEKVNVPLNLTFTVRSRAYILGRLVKSKFYNHIRCPVTLNGAHLTKPINMIHHCSYL